MKHFIQCIPMVFLLTWGVVQAEENPVADVQWGSTMIEFVNAVEGTLGLTVSGNSGEVYIITDYADGEIPRFLAYDEVGPYPDGHYKYELERPKSEEEPRLVQSGPFQIIDGGIVPYHQGDSE